MAVAQIQIVVLFLFFFFFGGGERIVSYSSQHEHCTAYQDALYAAKSLQGDMHVATLLGGNALRLDKRVEFVCVFPLCKFVVSFAWVLVLEGSYLLR